MSDSNQHQRHREFLSAFQPIQPNLERFVRAMTRRWNDDPEAARDLLSETIATVYEHFHTLRNPDALLSYCFTTATRLHRRQRAARQRTPTVAFDELGSAWNADNNHNHSLAFASSESEFSSDDVQRLYQALERLPEKQREAVIMFEILGFSMKEIQAAQGGTLIATKVRISRGRALLTSILNPSRNEASEAYDSAALTL
jgi:RNA polymerase sigma-70 factor, ECF subfamily